MKKLHKLANVFLQMVRDCYLQSCAHTLKLRTEKQNNGVLGIKLLDLVDLGSLYYVICAVCSVGRA